MSPWLSEPFLPDINNKTQSRRVKQVKESVQTGSVPDKSSQTVSKEDIALFRNSLKQNICVEMLQQGYHRSFSEFFSLLRSDEARRKAAAPGSAVWLQVALEDQPDKLEALRLHLVRAEQAERTGGWPAAAEQRLRLARFFSSPQDGWLSFHFSRSCVEREGSGTEARANMADLFLQQGLVEEARRQAELCVREAESGGGGGAGPRLRACRTLWTVYSRLAHALLADRQHAQALLLLREGYQRATDSADKRIEGEAAYQLGLAYQSAGDHVTAKQFFTMYTKTCSALQDADGLGKACKAMAKSMESEGKVDEAVQYLEKFADVSRSNGLQHNLLDACMSLGNIYCARALVGSARAHSLIRKHSADVDPAAPPGPGRLLGRGAAREQQAEQTAGQSEDTYDTDDTAAAADSEVPDFGLPQQHLNAA
ncbi:tetratricopeptide repeat protein 29 [Centroberyx affinis]|uniref:tetratricopeptide repeat protein 29 n=1 Tax=Centroberyx affinis TaxID=166261 RepID=UPI003A5BFC60